MSQFSQNVFRGLQTGFGFSLALACVWTVSAFAAAAWGNLPTVSTGSGLTATMWNDVTGQVNALASAIGVSGGNVGIGTTAAPVAKLEVNGSAVIRGSLTTASNLNDVAIASNMPNDMSFPANGNALGSVSDPMAIGTYYYQIYGCAGQNDFIGWALGSVVFHTGSGEATFTNYFDNANVGGGSCGYFRNGFIKVTTPNSTVRLKITNNYAGGSNADQNPGANSFHLHAWRLY